MNQNVKLIGNQGSDRQRLKRLLADYEETFPERSGQTKYNGITRDFIKEVMRDEDKYFAEAEARLKQLLENDPELFKALLSGNTDAFLESVQQIRKEFPELDATE